MQENKEKCMELATRIYELDEEVYRCVGSTLGRTFSGNRERTIRSLSAMMFDKPDAHLLRSQMALISNMARTIKNDGERSRLMKKYDEILQEVEKLPDSFSEGDIADKERILLNRLISRHRTPREDEHLVICISRTQGSAGNEIGFELADKLQINYYDSEIFTQVLRRLEVEEGTVMDPEAIQDFDKYNDRRRLNLKEALREFNRYHGLPKQDAMFFNTTDLICKLAQTEDCVIMGRCADIILRNHNIPHISLFISAPLEVRVKRTMETRGIGLKQATRLVKRMDKHHKSYYEFFTGEKWGKPDNYDMCINSANYGLKETVGVILRLLQRNAG